LDYLSCFLTVVSTILVARKRSSGLVIAAINSAIVCIIGFRTSQFGFIPANLFCIVVYAFSVGAWRAKRTLAPVPSRASSQGAVQTYVAGDYMPVAANVRVTASAPAAAKKFVAARPLAGTSKRANSAGLYLAYRASARTAAPGKASNLPDPPIQQSAYQG
jgi:hypothetical protein